MCVTEDWEESKHNLLCVHATADSDADAPIGVGGGSRFGHSHVMPPGNSRGWVALAHAMLEGGAAWPADMLLRRVRKVGEILLWCAILL